MEIMQIYNQMASDLTRRWTHLMLKKYKKEIDAAEYRSLNSQAAAEARLIEEERNQVLESIINQ